MTSIYALPQWNWSELETALTETAGDGALPTPLKHILQATQETAGELSTRELLKEILALGAIAHSLSVSTFPPIRPAEYCRGSA